jgi:hypothetical protein
MRSNEQVAGNNGKQKIQEELGAQKYRSRTHEARAQKPATETRGEGTKFKTACTQKSNTGDLEIQG